MAASYASLSVQACNPCKLHALHGCTPLLASAPLGAAKRATCKISRGECTLARLKHWNGSLLRVARRGSSEPRDSGFGLKISFWREFDSQIPRTVFCARNGV